MTLRLGANPIIWSNDDLRELGAEISLDTCLSQAREIGFEGMELGHKFPRDPEQLAAVLQSHGLACVSGWYSARLLTRDARAESAELRTHLKLLKALGSSVLVFAEVTGSVHGDLGRSLAERPHLSREDWRMFAGRLSELARMIADEGLRLTYHHHMGTVVESESDIERLMELCGPEVTLLLDTGHARFAGMDPAAVGHRYASRIGHFHAKDVRAGVCEEARAANWSFLHAVLQGVFTVPGDGCIDFRSVLQALRDYSGWVVLEAEQDPKRAEPSAYASLGYATLRRLISEELR